MPSLQKEIKGKKTKGFALVMALSLMSLVFLLVVSLVSLVGTDLNLTELRKQKVLAQANAKMGMMIAIGEIQKHLGPDTRVSATADLLDERVESSQNYVTQNYSAFSRSSTGIDLDENNQLDNLPFGQRHWTGVWKHRGKGIGEKIAKTLPYNWETGESVPNKSMTDSEFDPHPAIETAWLVSGNEGWNKRLAVLNGDLASDYIEIPDGLPQDGRSFVDDTYGRKENAWADYTDVVEEYFSNVSSDLYDPDYYHPLIELPDPDDSTFQDETVWLLKKPLLKSTYDPDKPADWKNHLSAEPVKVRKTKFSFPDEDEKNNNDEPETNAYAYWVGDEGVKTKINLVNPKKNQNTFDDLSVASEPNLETGFNLSFSQSDDSRRRDILSTGSLAEIDQVTGDSNTKTDIVSANYHDMTTESYGVLSDVRSGGLKRDLSSAFSESISDRVWKYDFDDFMYSHRINDYLKGIPYLNGAKHNEWRVESPSILDQNFVLAGPRWSAIKDFHNMWNSSDYVEIPDKFPRITGDPHVVFPYPRPPNRPNGELRRDFEDYMNVFLDMKTKPEPTNHPILPKLVEFKYSAFPVCQPSKTDSGKVVVGLAINPSVAFWNPYNVPIQLNNVFIEVPIHTRMSAVNPKEWDLFRKWYMHDPTVVNDGNGNDPFSLYIPNYITPSGSSQPSVFSSYFATTSTSSLPTLNFMDLNGNGKRDPGEPHIHRPPPKPPPPPPPPGGGGGGGGGGYVPRDNMLWPLSKEGLLNGELTIGKVKHPQANTSARFETFYDFRSDDNFSGFPPDPFPYGLNGRLKRYVFFRSNDQINESDPNKTPQERVLLLKIPEISLQPGQKAHFVHTESFNSELAWTELLGRTTRPPKLYVEVGLEKGDEGYCNPFILQTNQLHTSNEPITVRFHIDGLTGTSTSSREDFNRFNGNRENINKHHSPQGINVFVGDPRITNLSGQKRILKISEGYEIGLDSHNMDFYQANQLLLENTLDMINPEEGLIGNGFRMRWKFPGTPDNRASVVYNEFNPRALVDSMQEGLGGNYRFDRFNGIRLANRRSTNGFNSFEAHRGKDRIDFYANNLVSGTELNSSIHFVSSIPAPQSRCFGSSITNGNIVPAAGVNSATGHFHDQVSINSVSGSDSACLFDLPPSPLLSIAQLKHANLNNYSHGPAYVLGNSYSSAQVGRHKVWTRLNSLTQQISRSSEPLNTLHQKFNYTYKNQSFNLFPWPSYLELHYGPTRNPSAAGDHQNIAFDHSYFANNSLFDGYFMTGVHDFSYTNVTMGAMQPGDRFRPFRNPRLIPYLREDSIDNGEWKLTNYDQLSDMAKSVGLPNEEMRHQTIAGDLLLDGAFNVNSTSVDAWAAQLSALKGLSNSKSGDSESGTIFPRFLNKISVNEWNKICTLTDNEIRELAYNLVRHVKLRGPFLSYGDFVNRRISAEIRKNPVTLNFQKWEPETRNSVLSLRGAIQGAIADTGINFEGSSSPDSLSSDISIPQLPQNRHSQSSVEFDIFQPEFLEQSRLKISSFGLHAVSLSPKFLPNSKNHGWGSYEKWEQEWGQEPRPVTISNTNFVNPKTGAIASWSVDLQNFEQSTMGGEAPDNILAVENVATAANKPGWLMQADVLTPLAPVTSVRSDTFVIRVMGESMPTDSESFNTRAWIELTVQRTPDYIKPELDAPHHRPHEPFEDSDFNGWWTKGEGWLDLNKNAFDENGNEVSDGINDRPDLPGVGETGADDMFRDGLKSDIKLNEDEMEESLSSKDSISTLGINQRFGRKFKIVKFRWLNERDV